MSNINPSHGTFHNCKPYPTIKTNVHITIRHHPSPSSVEKPLPSAHHAAPREPRVLSTFVFRPWPRCRRIFTLGQNWEKTRHVSLGKKLGKTHKVVEDTLGGIIFISLLAFSEPFHRAYSYENDHVFWGDTTFLTQPFPR